MSKADALLPLRCPECKQILKDRPTGARWCAACDQPLGRHDKYYFRDDGRTQHRHCDRPRSYT